MAGLQEETIRLPLDGSVQTRCYTTHDHSFRDARSSPSADGVRFDQPPTRNDHFGSRVRNPSICIKSSEVDRSCGRGQEYHTGTRDGAAITTSRAGGPESISYVRLPPSQPLLRNTNLHIAPAPIHSLAAKTPMRAMISSSTGRRGTGRNRNYAKVAPPKMLDCTRRSPVSGLWAESSLRSRSKAHYPRQFSSLQIMSEARSKRKRQ